MFVGVMYELTECSALGVASGVAYGSEVVDRVFGQFEGAGF